MTRAGVKSHNSRSTQLRVRVLTGIAALLVLARAMTGWQESTADQTMEGVAREIGGASKVSKRQAERQGADLMAVPKRDPFAGTTRAVAQLSAASAAMVGQGQGQAAVASAMGMQAGVPPAPAAMSVLPVGGQATGPADFKVVGLWADSDGGGVFVESNGETRLIRVGKSTSSGLTLSQWDGRVALFKRNGTSETVSVQFNE